MSEHAAFIQAIIEDPEDDLPRLVYADWLEEQGDPRGEFIRLQVQSAALPEYDPARESLDQRAQQLLDAYIYGWTKPIGAQVQDLKFRRGFVESLTMRAKAFLERGEEIFQSTPIRWLRLVYFKNRVKGLLESDHLQHIRSWNASRISIAPHELEALLKSKKLTGLRELDLSFQNFRFHSQTTAAFAKACWVSQLSELNMYGVEIEESFWPDFLELGWNSLRRLSFGGGMTRTKPTSLEQLNAPNLESLRVGGKLRVVDVEQICQIPDLHLKQLDLARTKPPAKGMNVMAAAGVFEKVEELDLTRCDLTDAGTLTMLQGNFLKHCTSLRLGENQRLTSKVWGAVADHAALKNLRFLDLTDTPLDIQDLCMLAESPHLQNLIALWVTPNTQEHEVIDQWKERLGDGFQHRIRKNW